MIRRIEIIDFMAHKRTVLELDPGVTVLTGPNNTGKSAVVEAIRSVAENPPPKSVIRHGAKKSLVRVELDSGAVVEWDRTQNRALYRVTRPAPESSGPQADPESYAKFGRTPPNDVRALLRLDPIPTETGKVDIHIGNQRYPIFLLDQSGAQAASFFAASTEAEYLLQMQQQLKIRTDSAKRRGKEIEKELERLEQDLKRYADLPRLDAQIKQAETLYEQLEQNRRSLPQLHEALAALQRTTAKHWITNRAKRILAELRRPPEPLDCHGLERSLNNIRSTCRRHAAELQRRKILTPVPPPALQETSGLDRLRKSLRTTDRKRRAYARSQQTLAALDGPPTLFETAALERLLAHKRDTETLYQRMRAWSALLAAVQNPPRTFPVSNLAAILQDMTQLMAERTSANTRARQLKQLQPPVALHDVSALARTIAGLAEKRAGIRAIRLRRAQLAELTAPPQVLANRPLLELIRTCRSFRNRIRELKRQRTEIETALAEKRSSIAQRVAQIGVCPFCRQTMDLDHFLEGSHAK